jgi:hypothetical protein
MALTINQIGLWQTTFFALKNVSRTMRVFQIGFDKFDVHNCCTLRAA